MLSQVSNHTFIGKALSSTSVVLDLGANRGDFAHAIVNEFGCRCYAVEANPALCELIKPDSRIVLFNYAVASTSGVIPFYVSASNEASSIVKGSRPDVLRAIDVQAISLPDLLLLAGVECVDLIKFDIEGAEIEVLDSCSDEFLRGVAQLSIEFHDFCGLTNPAVVQRVVSRLQALGFFVIKIWRHAYGDTLFINRRLTPVSLSECVRARYITRNWWGLKRVIRRDIMRMR
jgi:FkbM family methyltransferase